MATYSIAQARNNIAELIDRAIRGEQVSITRHGKPMVDLIPSASGAAATVDLDWIRRHRVYPDPPLEPDPEGVHWVQRLREKDEL